MNILLLCHYDPFNASMVTDHIDAFAKYSRNQVFVHKTLLRNGGNLEDDLDLDWFDVIIVHYSIFIGVDAYLSLRSKMRLAKARAVKVVFLQDEYRFVQKSIDGLTAIDADIVFTCVPEQSIPSVYGDPALSRMRFVNTLTGYIPELLPVLPPKELKKRRYHVSYRGRRYPDWHGEMGREKFEIAKRFTAETRRSGLRTNISTRERDRVYGNAWIDLIQNSWAVLGVESGASVFDFSGEISAKTETTRSLLGKDGITYENLRQKYFAKAEGKIDLAQISPRVFEAISLRTLCILYEGSYSGLLRPNEHYLMLKKDFSNIESVVMSLKDPVFVSEVVSNAYFDVALNPRLSYKAFIQGFDGAIAEVAQKKYRGALGRLDSKEHIGSARTNRPAEDDDHQRAVLGRIQRDGALASAMSNTNRTKSLLKRILPHRLKTKIKSLLR